MVWTWQGQGAEIGAEEEISTPVLKPFPQGNQLWVSGAQPWPHALGNTQEPMKNASAQAPPQAT